MSDQASPQPIQPPTVPAPEPTTTDPQIVPAPAGQSMATNQVAAPTDTPAPVETGNPSASSVPNHNLSPMPDQPTSAVSRKEYDPTSPEPSPTPSEAPVFRPTAEHPPVDMAPNEIVSYTEVGAETEMDPEVAEFVQKVEKDKLELNEPVVVHGQTVVEPANWSGQPHFQAPLTRDQITTGDKASVSTSLRWLATWCIRMIKKFKGRVIFSDAKPTPTD